LSDPAKATKKPGVEPTLLWNNPAVRRIYFNTFDFDFKSESNFVVARFAFVRWGEAVDNFTAIFSKLLVESARESLLQYVKEVGFEILSSDFNIPSVPRFGKGAVETADIINVTRAGDVGEISLHAFALKEAFEASNDPKKALSAYPLAILRSSTSLQLKWIMTLYDHD